MAMGRESVVVRLSRMLYAGLLVFYPRDLRQKFGEEMADVFGSALRDAISERGLAGVISLWRSALWELLTVAVPLRLASNTVRAGAISLLASSVLFLALFRAVS